MPLYIEALAPLILETPKTEYLLSKNLGTVGPKGYFQRKLMLNFV